MSRIGVWALLMITLVGCNRKLSKEEAEKAWREKWPSNEDYNCRWNQFLTTDGSGDAVDYIATLPDPKEHPRSVACMDALQAKEIIEAPRCFEKRFQSEACFKARIKPGKKGSFSKAGKISFVCGKYDFKVTSVTTEDKSATAKWEADRTKNEELLKALEACPVEVVNPFGKATGDIKFSRDDDGKWQVKGN